MSNYSVQNKMDDTAIKLVHDWIEAHLDASDHEQGIGTWKTTEDGDLIATPMYEIFTVWKCKTLQNWKYLISTSLPDGMYFEATYNGDKHIWYLDAYKKFDHQNIPDPADA